MFACVYFLEDASLSVISQIDKAIVSREEWAPRGTLKMRWGQTIFSGMIIKVDETRGILDQFAASANSKLLKELKNVPDAVPEELFSFSVEEKDDLPRRKRNLGKTYSESDQAVNAVQQKDAPLAGAKLKAKVKAGRKTQKPTNGVTPTQKNAEKKREESASLEENVLMLELSDIQQQFQGPNNKSRVEQFKETSLGDTVKMIHNASSTLEGQSSSNFVTNSKIPAPPYELFRFFKCLYRPDVKNFIERFTTHFEQNSDCDHNSFDDCFQAPLRSQSKGSFVSLLDYDQEEPRSPIPPFFPSSGHHGIPLQTASDFVQQNPYLMYDTPGPQTNPNFSRQYEYQTYNPLYMQLNTCSQPDIQNLYSRDQNNSQDTQYSQTLLQSSSSVSISHLDNLSNQPNSSIYVESGRSQFEERPAASHHTSNKSSIQPFSPSPPESSVCDVDQTPTATSQQSLIATPRRSPRKHTNNSMMQITPESSHDQKSSKTTTKNKAHNTKIIASETPSGEKYAYLLEGSSVKVERQGFRKALKSAMDSKDPGYTLTMKLFPLLFTRQELSTSRGQGLVRASKTDLRPPLDAEKCTAVKGKTDRI